MQTARAQQPVGENMATLRISTELDFIHCQVIGAHPFRHRLNSADPILRARRHNPLFASDQSHHGWPAQRDNPVIDLTRQQAQRQADDARPMAQHAFNGVGGFTCVGGAQNGHNPALVRHVRS